MTLSYLANKYYSCVFDEEENNGQIVIVNGMSNSGKSSLIVQSIVPNLLRLNLHSQHTVLVFTNSTSQETLYKDSNWGNCTLVLENNFSNATFDEIRTFVNNLINKSQNSLTKHCTYTFVLDEYLASPSTEEFAFATNVHRTLQAQSSNVTFNWVFATQNLKTLDAMFKAKTCLFQHFDSVRDDNYGYIRQNYAFLTSRYLNPTVYNHIGKPTHPNPKAFFVVSNHFINQCFWIDWQQTPHKLSVEYENIRRAVPPPTTNDRLWQAHQG